MYESDDAFEHGLRTLEDLLVELAGDLHCAGAAGGPVDSASVNDADEALSLAARLLASWKLGRGTTLRAPVTEVLSRYPLVPPTAGTPRRADLAEKLPSILRVALDTLLKDDTMDRDPHGNVAVVARMLAALSMALEEDKIGCDGQAASLAGADELLVSLPAGATRH